MLPYRLSNRMFLPLAMAFVFLPTFIAVAADSATATAPGFDPPDPKSAILHGVIRNEDGNLLVGVRVRVVIPATDVKANAVENSDKVLETRTVKNGEYRIEIRGLEKPTLIVMDVMRPGYRRIHGTDFVDREIGSVTVTPGQRYERSFTLQPSLYFSFDIVNEQGKPIPGVEVHAAAVTGARLLQEIELTSSNSEGVAEVFNFPLEPVRVNNAPVATDVEVAFAHPDYLRHTIRDIYDIASNARRRIPVVLDAGSRISGTVTDVDGRPVSNEMVILSGLQPRWTATDREGRFEFKALRGGQSFVSVVDRGIEQQIKCEVNHDQDQLDLTLQLERMTLPKDLKIHSVLGIMLTDLTPEVRKAFALQSRFGVMVVDPGHDSERLGIGKLEKSFAFWRVGSADVQSVKQFITEILKRVNAPNSEGISSVPIVYWYAPTTASAGPLTRHLKLTNADIAELKSVLAEIEKE